LFRRCKLAVTYILMLMLIAAPANLDKVKAAGDTTAPVFSSIEVNKNQLTGGDKVKISVQASDEGSGIQSVLVVYKYSSTQDAEGIPLELNESSGKYESEIEVNGQNFNLNGQWNFYYISITDLDGNTLNVQRSQGDFSHADLSVSGNDIMPPELHGIEVEEKQIETGGLLKVAVDAYDSGSGVGSVTIQYMNEDRINIEEIELTYDEGTETFKGSLSIDESTVGGRWMVDRVIIYDQNGNVKYIDSTETQPYDPNAVDLSYADFFVIDTAPPIVKGVQEDGHYNHEVTIEFNEGRAYLHGNYYGGTIWNGEVVSEEGTYELEVTDTAGNHTTINFSIDYTPPAISGVSSGVLYNRDVTPEINEGTAYLNGELFESGTPVTEEGAYLLQAADKAGNESSVEFSIDKTAPVVEGVEPDGVYFTAVVPTFSEGTATLDGRPFLSGTSVVGEGRHLLIVSDEAQNHSIIVFHIDRTKPNVWGVEDGSFYNQNVTIYFNEGKPMLNGKSIANGEVVSEEGTYELIVTDEVGNETKITFTIDMTVPEIKGIEENALYNSDVTPVFEEASGLLDGKEFKSGTTITDEGDHVLAVTDQAGNKKEVHFAIDKTAPEISSVDEVTSESKTVTGATEPGATVLIKKDSQLLATVMADDNGYFNAEIEAQEADTTLTVISKDRAGNVSNPYEVVVKKVEPAIEFTDLNRYQDEIYYLTEKKIITGYPDGTFKPEEPIKRIQAIKMILREMGVDTSGSPDPGLTDMQPGSYGYEDVAAAVKLGFISGKNDGTFDPFGTLTRGQMAKILVKAYHLNGNIERDFTDVTKEHWAYDFINTLAANNITTGYDDNTFRANQQISRQHFSVFMARYLDDKFKKN
jgi:Bacterial Ig domain/S-layer homology domain/Bacterial Ig-like domain